MAAFIVVVIDPFVEIILQLLDGPLDDVAAALVLAAGVFMRARAQPRRSGAYLGTA